MKGDISRQTFDPRKHYTQVVMQQGRVQLDADWNEQQAIHQYRAETEAVDVIGREGAPQSGGGFEITLLPGDRDFLICPGRIYVDGILCELDEGMLVEVQGTQGNDSVVVQAWIVDGRAWDVGQWVELLNKDGQRLRYFQIRSVNAQEHTLSFHTDQEYPQLKSGEKDSVCSLRRVLTYTSQPDYPAPAYARKHTTVQELDLDKFSLLLAYLDVWQRHITAFDDPSIREVALDGPDTTTRLQTLWQVKLLPITLPEEVQQLIKEEADRVKNASSVVGQDERALRELKRLEDEIIDNLRTYDCDHAYPEWEQLIQPPNGTLIATTYNPDDPEGSGYYGRENQLYRVEIHSGTDAGSAAPSFKWARNNASILANALLNKETPDVVTIVSTGQGGILQFNKGQYVEVVSDESELNPQSRDLEKDLKRITKVEQEQSKLTFHEPLGAEADGAEITLRLWDGGGIIDSSGAPVPLHGGVKIQFSEGAYNSGDYWLIPARRSTQEVEWPPYEIPNTNPQPQTRRGVQHNYSHLGRVRWYKARNYTPARSVRDCRRRFAPLPDVVHAMHIMNINWNNDTTNPRRILQNGLEITLDAEPDQRHARAMAEDALVVTLESHIPGGAEGIFILNGDSEIRGNIITWHWNWTEKEGVAARLFKDIDRLGNRIFGNPRHFIRVRVRLKGHVIWYYVNARPVYLDGQAFALPGGDRGDGRHRLHLQFPSGNGVRASDFESWFYIRE
jgi:Family of unknown function (DUF6519)/Domain of unknown function (DUF4815)